jgi:hypothetical protein
VNPLRTHCGRNRLSGHVRGESGRWPSEAQSYRRRGDPPTSRQPQACGLKERRCGRLFDSAELLWKRLRCLIRQDDVCGRGSATAQFESAADWLRTKTTHASVDGRASSGQLPDDLFERFGGRADFAEEWV